MGSLLTYERRVVGTALLAVVPLAVAAVLLVWAGDFPEIVTWTVALLIGATLGVATIAIYEVVAYPLRTVANVISAVREEDYSIRAREARDGAILGEIMLELNELSATMRRRHLAALEAAALVRAVISEVDAAIFAFDATSRLELVNRAGERLLGDALIGRTAEELGVSDLLDLEEAATIERTFGVVTARWSVRVSVFRREGQTHRLLVVADISRALRQEEIRAWQRVVRVLGHELNNSLAPIKSIAGTLEEAVAMEKSETPLHANLARGLSVISRRADALARFLSVYSELARLPEPTLRAVELDGVVRRAVALDRRIEVVVEGGPPVRIEADEDQLEQAVINVIKNAVDASLETGGGVTVQWRVTGDSAELSVIDGGPGLASSANVFTPFFTTKPGGSGIGLVLSRQIAEAHGGTLELRNRSEGAGCEAVLRIPLAR
ncbi:MAG: two-component system, NtrC family, nitrogen regulation sensor histidine kinase NtrY [Acidobacteriota bacterium]|nr:two-component system, NtrC family, nitrogen regulation sensor histidine kinase NtrY [Acidobacteriota bacterium]